MPLSAQKENISVVSCKSTHVRCKLETLAFNKIVVFYEKLLCGLGPSIFMIPFKRFADFYYCTLEPGTISISLTVGCPLLV